MRNHVSKVHANSAPVARDGLRNCEERKQVMVLMTTVLPEHQGHRSHGRTLGVLPSSPPEFSFQIHPLFTASTRLVFCSSVFFFALFYKMVVLLCCGFQAFNM